MPELFQAGTSVPHERTALRSAGVAGLGCALPERFVSSDQIERHLGVEAGWIERRTGIAGRRHIGASESLTGLATAAGAAALADAGVAADQLDLVLVATMAADDLLPNAAPLVAHALGTTAAATDVGAACTGFLAALALAAPAIETGRAEHVLIIGAETMSRHVDHDDKRTAPLFGDGAGAAVLSAGAGAVGPVVLRSDGAQAQLITASRERGVIEMQGHETFIAAVARLSEATADAVAAAGAALDDVDLFVYHQANRRILAAIAQRLELDPSRIVDAIGDMGNTSAASVPLTLCQAADEGRLRPGDRVLVAAAGAGFTYGAALLEWGGA
jgi:3-oxoacyl-[acyl-carrier-protein] synthase-3